MKLFFKLALAAVILTVPMALSAQVKLGHINTATLRDALPEVTAANKKLDTLAAQYQKQLEELVADYQNKQSEYNQKFLSKPETDPIRISKETELKQFEDRIMAFREAANSDINAKTEQFVGPINKKITDAIKQVAQEGKYTYILESGNGTVLYAADSEDITPLVKKKLGIK